MAKMLLLNHQHPRLGIFVPELGGYRRFTDGRLEIDDSDPAYRSIMKTATRRSDITIVGEVAGVDGEVRQTRIKASAQFACDVCTPTQTFESAEELAIHTAALHAAAPVLTPEGEDTGGGRAAAGPTTIAPAKRKR